MEVGVTLSKCALPPVNDKRLTLYQCPKKCTVVNDAVLTSTHTVELERFCFYHCQPTGDRTPTQRLWSNYDPDAAFHGASLADVNCVPMAADTIGKVVNSDGSGRDAMLPSGI